MNRNIRNICTGSTAPGTLLCGILAWLAMLVAEAAAQPAWVFKPKPTTVLGSTEVGTAEAFTRIFNQTKGELAIQDGEFMATGGLSFNWEKLQEIFGHPQPIMGYMSRVVGSDIVHMLIRINLEASSLEAREIAVEFVVAEGTTLPFAVGTVFGQAFWRIISDGIAGHGGFTPGLLPPVDEEASTLIFLILPGVIKNPPRPGRIVIQYKFTSVVPPDSSPRLVTTPMETIRIVSPAGEGALEPVSR